MNSQHLLCLEGIPGQQLPPDSHGGEHEQVTPCPEEMEISRAMAFPQDWSDVPQIQLRLFLPTRQS